MNATLPNAQRKPRPKPQRLIRLLEPATADSDGWFALEIQVGKQTAQYLAKLVAWGDGPALHFELEKVDAELAAVETYRVTLSALPEESSCTCKGNQRHGHCKHVAGLEALRAAGQIS